MPRPSHHMCQCPLKNEVYHNSWYSYSKWTESVNNYEGFALDVISQNATVCNFCLRKTFSFFP